MLDPETLEKLSKAKQLAKIIQSLHARIDAHLEPICNDAIESGNRDAIKELIAELPPGPHKSGMQNYLDSLPLTTQKQQKR